jgi:FAD/FMN-containing dehydrogenase
VIASLFILTLAGNVTAGPIVNDVTRLNPIEVSAVIEPKSTAEIITAIKNSKGPISIGGGRYSMGGQTATEKGVQLDLRKFKKILNLDIPAKKITVQAGATWRDIQEEIDPHSLSIKIMQTYANFTVGGSLSVNAHGRYVGSGPLIHSIDSIKLVLADGKEARASPVENQEIFFAAVGGYGGIGVITEATLNLTKNEKVRREIKELPISEYKKYFQENVLSNPDAVFHNGDLYTKDCQSVRLENWFKTEKQLTEVTRLQPRGAYYFLIPNIISLISTFPLGREFRRNFLDPVLYRNEQVVWRNYEASYDVAQLEPMTPRWIWTYVLQEYFVPENQLEIFVPKMCGVFERNDVNVVNVSIRHAKRDSGSYLAWARENVFSFVIYYKQRTSDSAKEKTGNWTREMIDEVLSVNGRYYLPYQIHATEAQFKQAYPDSFKFFAIKRKVDPDNRFRNKLWDRYF